MAVVESTSKKLGTINSAKVEEDGTITLNVTMGEPRDSSSGKSLLLVSTGSEPLGLSAKGMKLLGSVMICAVKPKA